MMTTERRVVVNVPRGVDTVVVEVRWAREDVPPGPEPAPVPIYVMTTKPSSWRPEWSSVGAVGVHLRVLQTDASPDVVRAHLDEAQDLGLKVGLVIGVHNSRDWGRGTVFTGHVRRLPDGEVIPDYWSDAFMEEWIAVRRTVADAVRGHPALAWVGVDFGLDDESWPAKPWPRVIQAGVNVWEYQMRYVRAAHELARMFAPVPVLPQVQTMYSRQALDVLYRDAPENLGIKLNGLTPYPKPKDSVLAPYWERVGERGGMRMLEPGVVPTGDENEDGKVARVLVERAARVWQADAVNFQRAFVEALVESGNKGSVSRGGSDDQGEYEGDEQGDE